MLTWEYKYYWRSHKDLLDEYFLAHSFMNDIEYYEDAQYDPKGSHKTTIMSRKGCVIYLNKSDQIKTLTYVLMDNFCACFLYDATACYLYQTTHYDNQLPISSNQISDLCNYLNLKHSSSLTSFWKLLSAHH